MSDWLASPEAFHFDPNSGRVVGEADPDLITQCATNLYNAILTTNEFMDINYIPFSKTGKSGKVRVEARAANAPSPVRS